MHQLCLFSFIQETHPVRNVNLICRSFRAERSLRSTFPALLGNIFFSQSCLALCQNLRKSSILIFPQKEIQANDRFTIKLPRCCITGDTKCTSLRGHKISRRNDFLKKKKKRKKKLFLLLSAAASEAYPRSNKLQLKQNFWAKTEPQ